MSNRLQAQVKPAPGLSLTPSRTDRMRQLAEYRKERQGVDDLSTNPKEPFIAPPAKKLLQPGNQPIGTAVMASLEPRFGHNFGQMRVHTDLPEKTQTRLHASQSEGEQEQVANQPAQQVMDIPEPPAQEGNEATDIAPVTTEPAVEEIQTTELAEPTTGTAVTGETPSPGLLVEDSVDELGPGQMKKNEFLNELHTAVCTTAEEALAGTGRSAQGCPYIDYWFDIYRTRDSAYIERAIRRYAPEASGVTTARDYIPLITERIRRAISVWANTGEITEVPEGVPTDLNQAGGAGGGEKEAVSTLSRDKRLKASGSGVGDGGPEAIHRRLGEGRALDHGVRSRMERAFGHNFSRVRVHTDASAAEVTDEEGARALTVGEDIAFGVGEYRPGTMVGDAIIAHELAHVLQQEGGGTSVEPMTGSQVKYQGLEEDADGSAMRVMMALYGRARETLSSVAENARPRLKSGLSLQRCKRDGDTPARETTAPTTTASPPATLPPLPAITGVLTPVDNFSGRSASKFGIGEVVNLSFTATPTTTAASIGGLKWFIDSGGGTITGGADGLGVYTAGPTAESVKLVLKIDSGTRAGTVVSTNDITIVAPSSGYIVQRSGTGIWHVMGRASVGFKGNIFLRPTDVSFVNTQFREGTVTGVATGDLSFKSGEVHAETASWLSVGGGNSTTGSQAAVDTIATGQYPPPFTTGGTFLWAIPWRIKVGTNPESVFMTANHQENVDGAGKATIQKAGGGPFSKNLSDPSSSF